MLEGLKSELDANRGHRYGIPDSVIAEYKERAHPTINDLDKILLKHGLLLTKASALPQNLTEGSSILFGCN